MDMSNRLVAALAKLPNDPDAIADVLIRDGCVGTVRDSHMCPISVFVQRELRLGDYLIACIGRAKMSVHTNGAFDVVGVAAAPLPYDVVRFVTRFDGGYYPLLDMDLRVALTASSHRHPAVREA